MHTNSMTLVNSGKQDSWEQLRGKASPRTLSRIPTCLCRSCICAVCLALLLASSCRVPEEESGYVGPSAVETLGIEVDEMGIQVRELRRTKSRLQREIQARKADLAKYEKAQKEASRAALEAKIRLDKSLDSLHFVEKSQAKAIQRSKQIQTWLAELAKFESEKATLEKRMAALPALLEKARSAVAAQEAELGTLNAILEKAAVDKAAADKAAADKAAEDAKKAKKAPAKAAGAKKK